MAEAFDPKRYREALREDLRDLFTSFSPEGRAMTSLPGYLSLRVGFFAQAYLFGLASEVRPRLLEIVRWMEGRQPPDLAHWPEDKAHYRAGQASHFVWWQSLGLGRWLVRDEPATEDFARAIHVEWTGWQKATPAEASQDQSGRQQYLGQRLATSLLAGEPVLGTQFYEAARVRPPFDLGRPALEYGRWASAYLAGGNSRDALFVSRGTEMLRDTFLPYFVPSAAWFDVTLWLKAIYFDSGITRTAEETMLRICDCMPGVPRPDFAPG